MDQQVNLNSKIKKSCGVEVVAKRKFLKKLFKLDPKLNDLIVFKLTFLSN
jgi:hypothetical protein